MRLWLLCCALLFAATQGYEWIQHQAWFVAPELFSPWVVLGGVGLAIASNRFARSSDSRQPRQQGSQATPSLTPPSPWEASQTTTVTSTTPKTPRPRSTISFEIAKPKVRPGS
jgi:hypothetical protein